MLQTSKAEKVDEKMASFSSFHVPFLSYGPSFLEKVHFL